MNPHVLFIDVDGTLITYENSLPKSAVAAIQKVRENGHKVFFNTGRSKAEMPESILSIGHDGLILGNGNYVEIDDEVVFHKPMTLAETKSVVNWLHERGLEFYLESNSGLYASEDFLNQALPVVKQYMYHKDVVTTVDFEVSDIFPDMIYDAPLYRDDVNKISFILNSYQDYLDSKAQFPNLQANTWGGVNEKALFGDLGTKDINKSVAVDIALDHLKIDREDTFAFGDAKIDIPMLEYCKVGVAMGNGGDEIKAMADYITDAVAEDGLYNAFAYFGLI